MICPKCGENTAHAICDACGVDVIWWSRYKNPGTLILLDEDTTELVTECNEEECIEDALDATFHIHNQ